MNTVTNVTKGPLHHPTEERLMAYVTGEVNFGQRLLLEAHLGACDACADQIGFLSGPGGVGLREAAPAAVPLDLFDRIIAKIGTQERSHSMKVEGASIPLPQRIAAQLPGGAALRWKGVLRKGIRYLTLMEDHAKQAGLYLVHLKAGCAFPEHAHEGMEAAVILAGGARDGGEQLEAGDYREYRSGTAHEPEALPDEDCWLLTSLEGGNIRFGGWRGLVQQL